jgi:hypothetical protein
MIAPDEEQLDTAFSVAFDEFSDIGLVSDPDIDSDPGLLLVESGVFPDLSIMRKDDAYLVTALPQFPG